MQEKKTNCAKCGTSMTIMPNHVSEDTATKVKFGSQCNACGRYHCSSCADDDKACKCGKQNWRMSWYLPS